MSFRKSWAIFAQLLPRVTADATNGVSPRQNALKKALGRCARGTRPLSFVQP